MRRVALLAIGLLLSLSAPLTAQTQPPAQQQSKEPPHAWLFGAWVGGIFPPPVTLSLQQCLAQPMVIFTRDVVMRAVMTSPAYIQRQVDLMRVTADGFEFHFLPLTAGQLTPPDMGFGCGNSDVLRVQRRGENEIVFPHCSEFPYPLIRCTAR